MGFAETTGRGKRRRGEDGGSLTTDLGNNLLPLEDSEDVADEAVRNYIGKAEDLAGDEDY